MASNLQKPRRIGLYEKALPAKMDICRRMELAQKLGFDYWEISVDESSERLERLLWSRKQREWLRNRSWELDFPIHSLCLSGHRKYPFGSKDPAIRQRAMKMAEQAIELAYDLGVRIIQLAGYDVYYEEGDQQTHDYFVQGLADACALAGRAGVTLALEIMDTPYLNSIPKYLELKQEIYSPFLAVYPDLGNLFAWNNDLEKNLEQSIQDIVALHLKDSLRVRDGFPGQFRDLAIGEGEVDFVRYFEILKGLNYAGPFVIEMWASDNSDNEAAETAASEKLSQSLESIHRAMDSAGFATTS